MILFKKHFLYLLFLSSCSLLCGQEATTKEAILLKYKIVEEIEIKNGSFEDLSRKYYDEYDDMSEVEQWFDANIHFPNETPPSLHQLSENKFGVKSKRW